MAKPIANTKPLEWAKHLRRKGKKIFWKKARKNGKITAQKACKN